MRKIICSFLTLVFAFSLAACGQSVASSPAPTQEPAPEAVQAMVEEEIPDTAYPLTLVDMAGREVTLEAPPQRLVSGYYVSSSLLIALGQQDKMVGIESKPEKRPIYQLSAPQLLELPTVGSAKEFDLEGCAALEPDLVILPLRLKDAAVTLEELGIPVLLVNPESREELQETILLVAAATGAEERAQELLDFTQSKTTELESTLANVEKKTVYLAGNSDFLRTAGDAMYQSDMIRTAGGMNVAAEITDSYWVDTSYEQLLAWNPDYIVLASDANYSVEDVLADPNLTDCTAVAEGNVCRIPGDFEQWDSPVPSSFLGSVWLSTVLHPDLCSEDACTAIINEFYETFYGFQYNKN